MERRTPRPTARRPSPGCSTSWTPRSTRSTATASGRTWPTATAACTSTTSRTGQTLGAPLVQRRRPPGELHLQIREQLMVLRTRIEPSTWPADGGRAVDTGPPPVVQTFLASVVTTLRRSDACRGSPALVLRVRRLRPRLLIGAPFERRQSSHIDRSGPASSAGAGTQVGRSVVRWRDRERSPCP